MLKITDIEYSFLRSRRSSSGGDGPTCLKYCSAKSRSPYCNRYEAANYCESRRVERTRRISVASEGAVSPCLRNAHEGRPTLYLGRWHLGLGLAFGPCPQRQMQRRRYKHRQHLRLRLMQKILHYPVSSNAAETVLTIYTRMFRFDCGLKCLMYSFIFIFIFYWRSWLSYQARWLLMKHQAYHFAQPTHY